MYIVYRLSPRRSYQICLLYWFSSIFLDFGVSFMDFGARSHGFSLRILKNHVLGVFWHFGLHPQVLASADIWNFEGQIFTKIQYSEPKIFWCQKCPMDSMGRNGQELCIISYSIIRFVGKFWHLEIISSEYRKIFIFSHFFAFSTGRE